MTEQNKNLFTERNSILDRKDELALRAFRKPGMHQFNQTMKQFDKLREDATRLNEVVGMRGDKRIG